MIKSDVGFNTIFLLYSIFLNFTSSLGSYSYLQLKIIVTSILYKNNMYFSILFLHFQSPLPPEIKIGTFPLQLSSFKILIFSPFSPPLSFHSSKINFINHILPICTCILLLIQIVSLFFPIEKIITHWQDPIQGKGRKQNRIKFTQAQV